MIARPSPDDEGVAAPKPGAKPRRTGDPGRGHVAAVKTSHDLYEELGREDVERRDWRRHRRSDGKDKAMFNRMKTRVSRQTDLPCTARSRTVKLEQVADDREAVLRSKEGVSVNLPTSTSTS